MSPKNYSAPLAGALTGLSMATKSLEPSLMPRSAIDQGLIMAGSFATGYVAGSTAARVLNLLPSLGGSVGLHLAGAVATGAKATGFLGHVTQVRTSPTSPVSAWTETATVVLSQVALSGLPHRNGRPLGALTAVTVTASAAQDVHAALAVREDPFQQLCRIILPPRDVKRTLERNVGIAYFRGNIQILGK